MSRRAALWFSKLSQLVVFDAKSASANRVRTTAQRTRSLAPEWNVDFSVGLQKAH
jgi:hypothetical protein